jgi:hypothetical protein
LNPDEQDEVERWFFGDTARLELLELAEESLMERYIIADLSETERHSFETGFLITEDRIRGLRLMSSIYKVVAEWKPPGVVTPYTSEMHGWLDMPVSSRPSMLSFQSIRLLIIRFARWAGWLYFVDEELLESYVRQHQRRK